MKRAREEEATEGAEEEEVVDPEERWRLAGIVLRRVSPVAFEALLLGAEVMIAETNEHPLGYQFC